VYDFRRQLAAAINVSAPKGRLGHRLREAGELTRAAAGELSEALGRRGSSIPPGDRASAATHEV